MNLEDLIPKSATWKPTLVDCNGEESVHEFIFRPFNLGDEAYIRGELGGEKGLEKAFSQFDIETYCKLAFNQMTVDSKKKLLSMKFMDIDSNGNDYERAVKGHEKVGMFLSGMKDFSELVKLLLTTRGFSLPDAEKLSGMLEEVTNVEGVKKKLKRQSKKQTGRKSTI